MARILIADDDPAMITILTHLLSAEGYEVIVARDGIEALEAVHSSKPDLIVLDLMMPRLDGLGVLMRLYGDETPLKTPSILLTAQDPTEYKDLAESLGAKRFMEKPFDIRHLVTAVREILASSINDKGKN